MTKKNPMQSARASNQKRDPATGRFTKARHGVVLRRGSAASAASAGVVDIVPDVPPGYESIKNDPNRAGGSTFLSAQPEASARREISSSAAERVLRRSERLQKGKETLPEVKIEDKGKELLTDKGKELLTEVKIEEKGKEPLSQMTSELRRKEKKMNFWQLQKAVAESQENVKWLEGELNVEKKRKARLHVALIAASEKALGFR